MNFLVVVGAAVVGLYFLTRPSPAAAASGGSGAPPPSIPWPPGFGPNGLAAWNRFTSQGLAVLMNRGPVWVQIGAPQMGMVTLTISPPSSRPNENAFVGVHPGAWGPMPFTAEEVYAVSPSYDGRTFFTDQDAAVAYRAS